MNSITEQLDEMRESTLGISRPSQYIARLDAALPTRKARNNEKTGNT